MKVRYGKQSDITWLQKNDAYISDKWIKRCVRHNEYIVAVVNKEIRGFLRFSMFWGKIPYMDLIWVNPDYRQSGIGRELFAFWEKEMKKDGKVTLMTSSMLEESEPQKWHKKQGFRKCGKLTFGNQQPSPEVFFVKNVSSD